MRKMIEVELIAKTDVPPPELITFAARSCYQNKMPEMGGVMDIENKLFKTGHHTTVQHNYFTFFIEGIAVSGVTLGLHLVSPFYNTSQRSGRFCGEMYSNPDYKWIEEYIRFFWSEVETADVTRAMNFVKDGIGVYLDNFNEAVKVAEQFIRRERPRANEKFVEINCQKFAQEQLRMFIPTIFPTAGLFSIDLSTLVAMYCVAWNPVMKQVTQKMADIVLDLYPNLDFMFKPFEEQRQRGDFDLDLDFWNEKPKVYFCPDLHSVSIDPAIDDLKYRVLSDKHLYPVDLLHFMPKFMDYSTVDIKCWIEISMATMGQDQRHRTIHRGLPFFTGNFYAPPIVAELGLSEEGLRMVEKWLALRDSLPVSLVQSLAPYGAMVGYRKSIELNALIHEANKRLCWCSQEEIYHLALSLYRHVVEKRGENRFLAKIFAPTCLANGKCGEGDRYCGRDLQALDYFTERKI